MAKSQTRSTNFIRSIFSLMRDHPWLLDSEEELLALVDECDNDDEVDLVFNLLNRFTYLDYKSYSESLEECINQITKVWGLDQSNTQLMATSIDDNPDSGQYVLYGLKSKLQRLGWSNPKLVNRAAKPTKYIEKYPNIVLIDEFIGTGSTIIGRIKNFQRIANQQKKSLENVNIYICAIASTNIGKVSIEEEGYPVFASYYLEKGISECVDVSERESRINQMLRLESILTDECNGSEMPSLGYGRCEALYGREDGNVPNNVFPIFWWPYRRDNSYRSTLLIRQMGDA